MLGEEEGATSTLGSSLPSSSTQTWQTHPKAGSKLQPAAPAHRSRAPLSPIGSLQGASHKMSLSIGTQTCLSSLPPNRQPAPISARRKRLVLPEENVRGQSGLVGILTQLNRLPCACDWVALLPEQHSYWFPEAAGFGCSICSLPESAHAGHVVALEGWHTHGAARRWLGHAEGFGCALEA